MVLPEPTSPCSSRFMGPSWDSSSASVLPDGGLPRGQRERQLAVEGGQESVGHGPPGRCFLRGQLGAAPRQGGLQDQRLLVAEAVPGPRQSSGVCGAWIRR